MARLTRQATCRLLDMVDEGILNPREVLRNALGYMSEDDVADFAHREGYFEDEDDEDEAEDAEVTA